MVEKSTLYFLAKIVTVIASVSIYISSNADITFSVISALGFACVFVLEILLHRIFQNKRIFMVTAFLSIGACFALGLDTFFPLYIILVIQILDLTIEDKMFYEILIVTTLLSMFIFTPSKISISLSFILITLILFARIVLAKLTFYEETCDKQKEKVIELNKKLGDLKSLTKTLKYNASLEERNRIAARIHDQIGHGISGSILMLEAAMLIRNDNPEKATASIKKAITNLREGVDDIRMALREERAVRYTLGKNDIATCLEEFKISYNIATHLKILGSIELIRFDVWACILDNLKESLTNVLKHSNASEFVLNIEVYKKIVKVEYIDNGKSNDIFEKGLGLEAIEERTINTKGRCFFSKGENGFCITNIFSI